MKYSGLLDIFVQSVIPHLGGSIWLQTLQLVVVTLVMTTFVSHTVSALILMSFIVSIGNNIWFLMLTYTNYQLNVYK